jgi:6-phosphogluconolactonase (cycloisomerase 2 family)
LISKGKWLRLWLAAAPFVAGCAGFWNPPTTTTSTGCTTNCTTASSGNFYILNGGSSPQIAGEVISSGKLNSIPGSPWSLSQFVTPYAMAFAPSGNFLYVSTISGVYVFPVSNGALQTASAALVSSDTSALAIAADTSGKWLIEALQGQNAVTLAAVPLNPSTGGFTGSGEVTATYPVNNAAIRNGEIAVSPDDAHVFVALGQGGTLAAPFNAGVSAGSNPFSNTAVTIPAANSGGSALSVAVDPGGALFYIGETLAASSGTSITGGLRAFTLASLGGTLAPVSGSPIASGGTAPNAILPASSGAVVYVANGNGTSSAGNIASFSITTSSSSGNPTYTIAAGSTIAAGTQPVSLAIDSTGAFLLAVNSSGATELSTYTFGATPGALVTQITANTGASPMQILALP